ncbi:hypothetical protein PoB_007323000 [Plakobranchus ocellatus]|uniref:Uncharacterized protein n=1 Tax=Plakobranchus ocellatus TaxID=259542 RepID=A0AAV4DRQ4_9GAST|nr:hypothetical protein PoB_007323000 [Plakobranchus ocellatus]
MMNYTKSPQYYVIVATASKETTLKDVLSNNNGDLRLSGLRQKVGSGTRTRDRRIPADLRVNSLTTVPSKSPPPRNKARV